MALLAQNINAALVAPLAGAGIEIESRHPPKAAKWSPLSQGRELKYPWGRFALRPWCVAPLAGAGIEIFCISFVMASTRPSPLSQGRELKYPQQSEQLPVFRRPSRRGGN